MVSIALNRTLKHRFRANGMWVLTKSEMKFSLEKFVIDAEYAS